MNNDIIRDGPFIFALTNKQCCYCDKQIQIKEQGFILQCMHCLHFECSEEIISEKFGEDVCLVTIDKSKIWNFLNNKKYGKMHFGTKETSGIIHCPECNKAYSILSPIYKEFGIPKEIYKTIVFDHDKEPVIYHMCTNIDCVNLLKPNLQKNILQNFDYFKEDICFDDVDIENDQQICLLKKYDDLIFHAVLIDNLTLTYFPTSK